MLNLPTIVVSFPLAALVLYFFRTPFIALPETNERLEEASLQPKADLKLRRRILPKQARGEPITTENIVIDMMIDMMK